jgi:hypothetical protein
MTDRRATGGVRAAARRWVLRVAPGIALALLLAGPGGCQKPGKGLAGPYRSTWGHCLVEAQGAQAMIRYPRGRMSCTVEGQILRCDWESGAATGKARFDLQQDGTLIGRWGRGARDDDGGEWAMVPEGS